MLKVSNLYASYNRKEIVKDVSLSISPGETVILMGQNGSGKSTMANVLIGNSNYTLKKGKIELDKIDITKLPANERVRQGLFLAWQNPMLIPGVSLTKLVVELNLQKDISQAVKNLRKFARELDLAESFLTRGLNDGFSGGERKKLEMLQALMFAKKYVIFDEIDTGLDVDALKQIAKQINKLKKRGIGSLVITHYQGLLKLLSVDRVLVFKNGQIVKQGTVSLADKIQKHGYSSI